MGSSCQHLGYRVNGIIWTFPTVKEDILWYVLKHCLVVYYEVGWVWWSWGKQEWWMELHQHMSVHSKWFSDHIALRHLCFLRSLVLTVTLGCCPSYPLWNTQLEEWHVLSSILLNCCFNVGINPDVINPPENKSFKHLPPPPLYVSTSGALLGASSDYRCIKYRQTHTEKLQPIKRNQMKFKTINSLLDELNLLNQLSFCSIIYWHFVVLTSTIPQHPPIIGNIKIQELCCCNINIKENPERT